MKKLKWCFPGWEVPCDHTPSLPHVPSPRLWPVTELHRRVQLMSLRASQSQTVCLEGTKTPVASLLSPTRQLNKPVQHNSSNVLLPHTLLCCPPSPCLSLIKMTHAFLDRQRPAHRPDWCSALTVLSAVWVSSGLWSSHCFPSLSFVNTWNIFKWQLQRPKYEKVHTQLYQKLN